MLTERIKVGSDGFVQLVDHMGDDLAIVAAARTSYGTQVGALLSEKDVTLLRYLMRHRHTTPFEMVETKWFVRCPMDTWRQWIRHRTASVNEYSTRYTEAIDAVEVQETWRAQSGSNKQGSDGTVTEWPNFVKPVEMMAGKWYVQNTRTNELGHWSWDHEPTVQEYLSALEEDVHHITRDFYEHLLQFGVAKEQARKNLPLTTYTQAYWKIDLHNLFHFLSLRLDKHAQQEIREFSEAIATIAERFWPESWRAFMDYRVNTVTFTGPEIRGETLTGRELDEYNAKLKIFNPVGL